MKEEEEEESTTKDFCRMRFQRMGDRGSIHNVNLATPRTTTNDLANDKSYSFYEKTKSLVVGMLSTMVRIVDGNFG